MAEKKTNKERLKEITDSIEAGIQELFQSEKYMDYLRTMSRFHKYSFNNTMLIHLQKPDATLVAGFNKWEQKFNRHVKHGEKGIKIIAPTPFKKKIEQEKLDPDTKLPMRDKDGNIITEEKEVQIPMFKPVAVFDVSQTEGEPLPTLAADLKGDVKHYEVFMEALRRSAPVPLEFEKMVANMDGYFSRDNQRIAIREGMSEVQTISAAVHEIAHAKLHNIKDKLVIDDKEQYQEIELFDKPALFSNGRIDRDKLPEGLFCYDLRGSDDDPGAPVTVEARVAVNHAGAVILAEPLDFGEDGYLVLGEDMNFTGGEVTLKQFYEQMYPDKVEKDRNTEEVEAESISFAVCAYYGIETGANSFGYIASWSRGCELKELRASLETINRTADNLISDIDRNFTEICKERGIDLSNEQVGTATAIPGESVSDAGKAPEAEPDEQFYKVNNDQYLHIQRCDTGYDYTFYDAASKAAMDGGQLDAPELSILAAAEEVCALFDKSSDNLEVAAGKLPEEYAEATPAPRDYRAELVEHFAREDERMMDTALDESPMPDISVSTEEMQAFGYTDVDMLPVSRERAIELMEQDLPVYMLYADGTEGMAFEPEELSAHDGMFGIAYEDWRNSEAFGKAVEERLEHQQEREEAFLNHTGDSIAIYQLKRGDKYRDYAFESMDSLVKRNLAVSRENYDLIYTAISPYTGSPYETLEAIFHDFNMDIPADFGGHSLSVSDIVAIRKDSVLSCHYVDNVGYRDLPDFLQPENYLKSAEMQMEDDYNMVDGVINNGPKQPTVAELEEQVKSGQSISLMDLAGAVHREKEAKQQNSMPEKKSSILAKIRKPLPTRENTKTAPEKSAERGDVR